MTPSRLITIFMAVMITLTLCALPPPVQAAISRMAVHPQQSVTLCSPSATLHATAVQMHQDFLLNKSIVNAPPFMNDEEGITIVENPINHGFVGWFHVKYPPRICYERRQIKTTIKHLT